VSHDFKGTAALVTGGAKGIGEATVRRLSSAGAKIVIADLDEAAGVALAAELPRAVFLRTDVTSESAIAAAVDAAVSRFGGLDLMINNAGVVGAVGSIVETTADQWSKTLDVLLNGVFFGAKHAARVMIPRRSGVILSLASTAGIVGGQGPHCYSAAKAAVIGLTRSLASELSAHRIRVNAVAPGMTVTPMISSLYGSRDNALTRAAELSNLGSAILPDEIAATLLYLAGPDAAHITGQTIAVDSGRSAAGNGVPAFHSQSSSFVGASQL
jgi:NAD(P)-dependent dehydrogenase (short-subunit alcohol dehydrogenase family)